MSSMLKPARARHTWWYALFALQFVAVLWPPFFNRAEPRWFGVPFFYWYQLLWVLLGAVSTGIIYRAVQKAPRSR